MQATVETISNLERRMTVVVPMQPIEEEVSQRIANLARTVKLAGFRPGKVPLKLVQQQYGPQVRDEVLSKTVERTFSDAVEENKLRVAGFPSIEHKPFSNVKDQFEYIATFEIFPEIKIDKLDKVKIEKPVLEVTDADVKKTIDVLVKQRATYESVKRAAKKGDKVKVTLRASINGEEVENTGEQGLELVLGEGGRVAEFDDNLAGSKAGSSKTFEISYPEDHKPEQLAGKTVSYEVTFLDVQQAKMPEVDAEFARNLGIEDGDVEKMQAEIKESLKQEVDKRIRSRLKEQVFQVLVDNVEVDLPKALLDVEVKRLMQMTQNNLKQRGVDVSNITLEPALFEEQAKRNASLRLILGEIITKNNLQATPEQIRAMVDQFGQSFERPEEVVRWYYEDPTRLEEPAALATEENVVSWVLAAAKVTDKKVKFDDLMGNS
ncbi:MAG TPA: trigger factor [Methylophilaceae bacterium]|nr:trigger factor [Methylophilaceae bacterium]